MAGESSATLKFVSAGHANSAGLQCQGLGRPVLGDYAILRQGGLANNAVLGQGLVSAIDGQGGLVYAVLVRLFGIAISCQCGVLTAKRQRHGLWSCRCGVGDFVQHTQGDV